MVSLTPNDERGADFDSESLARVLFEDLGQREGDLLYVALSGGVDSCTLLDALVELRAQGRLTVKALHVNHGLNPQAIDWETHCAQLCRRYGVPLETVRLQLGQAQAGGVEGRARAARYAWLALQVGRGTLVTAHHRDDQVETVLLHLVRGAGIAGMSGMPAVRRLGEGRVIRPLLRFWRSELERYARDRSLTWVMDPSNSEDSLARNYMRHRVLPMIGQRWPAAPRRIATLAEHAREAQGLLQTLAAGDLAGVAHGVEPVVVGGGARLRLADLAAFTDARLGNLIRHWFQQHGFAPPGARRLREIIQRMIRDPGTAATVIAWSGRELRRYRGWLYLMRSLPCRDPRDEWRWDLDAPFQLPGAGVCLHARRATGVGLAVERLTVPVTVRWRRGGEVCRLPGRSHHHSLKKLFQEKHIPPWQRSRIPLVYADGCLAAVVGLWYCEPFCARPSEPGVEVLTRSADADSIVTQDWLW